MSYNGFSHSDVEAFHRDAPLVGAHARADTVTAISSQATARDVKHLVRLQKDFLRAVDAAPRFAEACTAAEDAGARIHALEAELRTARALSKDAGGADALALLAEIRDELRTANQRGDNRCNCCVS